MRSIADRPLRLAAGCLGGLLLAGCAAPDPRMGDPNQPGHIEQLMDPGSEVPAALRPVIASDRLEGERNRVLNEAQAGLTALELHDPALAQRLLADAQAQIETIYADNPAANEARSKFVPEAHKDFKGDPYERAMVGYYLALADFSDPDLDNARADLRFAELQDTMSADEVYQSDMVIMPYLRGWLYNCSGEPQRAADEFKLVTQVKPGIKLPGKDDNVLLIGEVGSAPGKYATGRYREELRYRRTDDGHIQGVSFVHGKRLLFGQQIEDVYWQAATRGGRAVDKILAGKASFRDTAENIATGAAIISHISSDLAQDAMRRNNSDDAQQYAGLALLGAAVSIGSDLVAAATRAEADTRAWSTLPDRIYVATAQVKDLSDADVWSLGFHDAQGRLQHAVEMKTFRSGACLLAWGRQYPDAAELWPDSSERHASALAPSCQEGCKAVTEQIELDRKNFAEPAAAPAPAAAPVPEQPATAPPRVLRGRILLTPGN
ncbi:MAG: hypothetical protein AB1722_08330 [Pseudomonadota bacterium]